MRGDNMFIPTTTGEEKAKRKVLAYGLPREIPHEDYFEGDVIYSDGSFGRMYRLSPVFLDSLDELEQENFSSAVASALAVPGCDVQLLWRKKARPVLRRRPVGPVLFYGRRQEENVFRDGRLKSFFPWNARCGSGENIPDRCREACRASSNLT